MVLYCLSFRPLHVWAFKSITPRDSCCLSSSRLSVIQPSLVMLSYNYFSMEVTRVEGVGAEPPHIIILPNAHTIPLLRT